MPTDKSLYLPILVGADRNDNGDTDFQLDNDGQNISYKNPNYNELTAVYWAWRNLKNVDAVGLVHYRRYFFKSFKKRNIENIVDKNDVEQILKNHDAILPKKRNYLIETNYSHYIHAHHKKPIDETRNIIKEIYPDYLKSFDLVMSRRRAHMFNMFIMRKDCFDQYTMWLMSILQELETRIDISNYSVQESRVYGYISELLMDVWINANDIDYVEFPWKQLGSIQVISKAINFLKRKFLPELGSQTHF